MSVIDIYQFEIVRRNGDAYTVTIDAADLELVSQRRWYIKVSGNGMAYPATYARVDGEPKHTRMHNFLLGATGVDHKDGNPMNNTRANLRFATHTENMRNRRGWGKSGLKGVRAQGNRWVARIGIDGVYTYLGMFRTAEEAANAYDVAAIEAFGEFARLNGAAA